jgi:hypothetical protein
MSPDEMQELKSLVGLDNGKCLSANDIIKQLKRGKKKSKPPLIPAATLRGRCNQLMRQIQTLENG